MVFRKRKQPAEDAAEPEAHQDSAGSAQAGQTAHDDAPIPADRATDFLVEILRCYGENAFDTDHHPADETRDFFEKWARHVLIGVDPPGREDSDSDRETDPTAARDLPGLRLAFRGHRESEATYVTASLGDFRDAAWAFISGMRRSLAAEQSSDRRVGHRMRRLESAVRKGDAALIKAEALETVGLLTEFLAERGARERDHISEMAGRLESLRDELDSVRTKAAIDPVTEIYNRSAFDEQIERELDLASIFGKSVCLLMVDVDHFKWVNDTHGHRCGDEVLKQIAATLSRCFMRRGDFLARYGGEEFVVVLREVDAALAGTVAERGMMAIRNLEVNFDGVDEPIRVTASIGIATLRKGETAASWIERADRCLYRAKDDGRDRISIDPMDLETAGKS